MFEYRAFVRMGNVRLFVILVVFVFVFAIDSHKVLSAEGPWWNKGSGTDSVANSDSNTKVDTSVQNRTWKTSTDRTGRTSTVSKSNNQGLSGSKGTSSFQRSSNSQRTSNQKRQSVNYKAEATPWWGKGKGQVSRQQKNNGGKTSESSPSTVKRTTGKSPVGWPVSEKNKSNSGKTPTGWPAPKSEKNNFQKTTAGWPVAADVDNGVSSRNSPNSAVNESPSDKNWWDKTTSPDRTSTGKSSLSSGIWWK